MLRKYIRQAFPLTQFIILTVSSFVISQSAKPKVPDDIWVRDGYHLELAVSPNDAPRFMALSPEGTLYFNHSRTDVITAAVDKDKDGYYETLTQFLESRNRVFQILWYDGYLWYTESGAIYKAKDSNGDGIADEIIAVIEEGILPSGGGHAWRPILVHNGRMYTEIGDSGNITDELDSERQKIWSFNLYGKDKKLFCSGTRNTEKLVVRPGTDEIWGMDHGSDWFGREVGDSRGMQPITDYNPPDEMNHYVEGGFYGHPFIVGNRIPRYEYLDRDDIIELAAKTIVPEWTSGAHWAANSMTFYTGDQFPSEIKGDAFVSYHGSWNRSVKSGYQISRVLFEFGHPYGEQPFVIFLNDKMEVLGRPVDTLVEPDGSLLISEDNGHQGTFRIYRLKYTGKK